MFNYHSACQTSDGQHISRFSVNMLTNILLTSPPKVLSYTWPTEVSTLGLQTGLEWHCIDRNKLDHNGTIKWSTCMYCSLSQSKTSSMDWNGPEWNKMAQNRKQMKMECTGMSSRSKENVYIKSTSNSFEQIPVYRSISTHWESFGSFWCQGWIFFVLVHHSTYHLDNTWSSQVLYMIFSITEYLKCYISFPS